MARTALTPVTMPGSYTGAWTVFTFAAADNANGNAFALAPNDILLLFNSTGGTLTATLTSVADKLGRTGDITAVNLAAGAYAVFGPIQLDGWKQTDGNFYLTASAVGVKFAILRAA